MAECVWRDWLTFAGFFLRRPVLVLLGAAVGLGFDYYVLHTRLWWYPLVAFPANVAGAVALERRHMVLAWLLCVPMAALPSVLAIVAVTSVTSSSQ